MFLPVKYKMKPATWPAACGAVEALARGGWGARQLDGPEGGGSGGGALARRKTIKGLGALGSEMGQKGGVRLKQIGRAHV